MPPIRRRPVLGDLQQRSRPRPAARTALSNDRNEVLQRILDALEYMSTQPHALRLLRRRILTDQGAFDDLLRELETRENHAPPPRGMGDAFQRVIRLPAFTFNERHHEAWSRPILVVLLGLGVAVPPDPPRRRRRPLEWPEELDLPR